MSTEIKKRIREHTTKFRKQFKQTLKSYTKSGKNEAFRDSFPFKGFEPSDIDLCVIDRLTDIQLEELNHILPWNCFVVDKQGRRFGAPASSHKRNSPQNMEDYRIKLLAKTFDLQNKKVTEFGCFEGVHTAALCRSGAEVTAIDSRIENVVKTIVRCSLLGCSPKVFPHNLEEASTDLLKCDVLFHCGVLYHLSNPIEHVLQFKNFVKEGFLLDTHVAAPGEADAEISFDGVVYKCKSYEEGGYENVFAGMIPKAMWLQLNDLVHFIKLAGFTQVDVVETREERNGKRVLLMAKKSP